MARTPPVLTEYLAGVDASFAPLVRALDRAVRSGHRGFDVAITYRMLTYALDGDWRTWVCAVGVSAKTVNLRFLYGVLLEDPLDVLRAGSSVLMTWDFAPGDRVDVEAVRSYVAEAVRRYPEYKADADAIQERAKAAAKATSKRRLR